MSLRSRAPKGERQTLFGWLLTSSSLFRAEQELWKYVHFKFFCDTGILICATQTHAHHEVLRVTGIRSTPPGDGKTFSIDVDSVNPASPRKACHSNRRILVGTPDSKVCKEWVDNLTIYIQQLSSGCTEERKQLSNLEDMVPNTKVNCTLCQAMEATANGAGPRGGRRGAGSWRACAQCGRRWCPRCKRRGMVKVLLRPEVSAELQGHGPFGGGGGGRCLPLRRWGRPGGGAGARFGLCLPCAVIPGDRPTPSRCALCGDRLRPRSWPRPRRCARCLEVFCSGCRPRRRRAGDGEASTEACCALCLARGRIEHTLLDGDLERANTSTTVKKPKPEDEKVVHHSLEKFKSQESPPPELSPFEKLRADKMYERFFKMQSYGVPGIAICQKMLMEGTDLEIIRLFAAGNNVSDEELEPILPISAKANDKGGHLRGLGPEAHPSSEVDEQKKTQLPKVPSPIKMRRFFWNPIRESSKGGAAAAAGQGHRPLAGSVWRRATARRAAAPAAAAFRAGGGGGARGPDARGRQELARLFGGRGAQEPSLTTAPVADTNNGQRRAKNSAAALGKQAQPIRLLDPRRSQNMAIAAAQFKDMDYSAAAWAAVGLALDSRRVEVLAGALPTPEECASLLAHRRGGTGGEDLAEGERLARALAAVPRLDAKFHTLRYYYSFERVLKQLDLEIGHVTKACLQILESEGLARVLETILAIGNLLNHGSEIGEAEGFSVDSLLKLSQTKSLDGSITLLDYFVQVIYEKGEDDILDLLGIEFTSLDAAYRLSDTVLTGQHRSLEMDLRKVQMEYELIQGDLQCKQTSNENNTCPSQSIQNVESSGHAMLQAIRTRKEAGALPSSARSSLLQAIQARGQSNDEPQISHCTKGQAHQNATGAGGSRSAMLQAIRARKEAGALPSSSRSSLLQAIQARGQSNDELQISHHDKGQANQSAVDAGGGRSAMLQAIRTRKEACAPLSSARSSLLQAIQARGQSSGKPQTSPDKRQDHQSALDAAGGGRSSMLQAILTRKEAGASPSSARSSLLQAIQALGQRNDEPQTSPDKGQAHQSAIDAGGGRSSAMLQAICTMKETNSPLCGARSSLFHPTQAREQNEMSSGPQTIPKKGQARHKKDADAPLSSARASTLQPIQLVNCNQNSLTVLVNDHDEQKIPAPTPFDTARNSICGSETSCLSFLSLDDEDQDQYDNHSYKCEKAELVDNLKIAQQRKSSGSIEGAGSFPCCEEQDTVNLGSPGHKSPIQVPGLGEHLEARPSITSSSDQSFCSAGTRGSAESLVQFTVIQDTRFSGSPVPKLNFSQLNTPPARGDSCLQGQANSGRLSMKESVLEPCSVGTETNSVPVKLSPEDPGKLLSTGIRESFKRLASSEEATGDDHGKFPFTLATGAVVDAHGSPAASAAAEVKLVDNEVPSLSPPEHATRALAMALRQFCPRAQVELAEVGSRAEEMQRRARELAHYFCENPGPATQETIMATLREFICLLVSSYKALLSKKARKGRLSNKPHDAGFHPARPKLENHGRSRPLPGPPPPPERLLLHNLLPPPDHPRAGATARSRIKIGQKLQTPYGLGAVQAYRRIDDVLVVDLGWSMCYLGGLLNNVWEPTEEVGLQLGKKNVHTKAKEGVATPRNHSQHTKKRSIGFLTNTSLGHAQSVGKDMLAKSKTPSETTRCKKGLAFPAGGASPLLVCDRMLVDDLVAQKEDNTSIMNSKAAAIDSLMPSQLKPQITSQSFSTSHHIMASIDREILNSLKDLRLAHSMTQSSAFGASKIMSRKPQLNFSTAKRTLHFQPNLDVKESSGQMQTEGSDCLDGFDASISGSVGNVVFGDHYDLGAANSGSNNKMNLTCSTLLCGIDRDQGQQGRAVQVSTRQKRLSF